MTPSTASSSKSIFSLAVVVAALGYFVDIYDLLLFSIIRVPSLQSLGLTGDQLTIGSAARRVLYYTIVRTPGILNKSI